MFVKVEKAFSIMKNNVRIQYKELLTTDGQLDHRDLLSLTLLPVLSNFNNVIH